MKRGRGVLKQLTYQFEVTATDFKYDRYKKLLANKKVRNFIVREFKRQNTTIYNGWITSMRPVLITTFKSWLDCTDNQLWPAYVSKQFLESQKDNPNTLLYKLNGIEEVPSVDEYIVEPIDYVDVQVEKDSDEEWQELLEDDIDTNGEQISYKEKTKQYMRELRDKNIIRHMDDDDIEHYVQYCHRKRWDVLKFTNWIWAAYAVKIRGDPTRFELRDYNDDFMSLDPIE